MTDLTDKTWMAIGETDDSNALIETCDAEEAATKGAPVCLSNDQSLSYSSRTKLHRSSNEKLPLPNSRPSPKSELKPQFR